MRKSSVILVRLVYHLPLPHHRHEDDAVGIRLWNAFLVEVVESRRDVLLIVASNCAGVKPSLTLTSLSTNFALMPFDASDPPSLRF